MSRLLIIGAGGHGAVVADAAAESGKWSEIAFLDDRHVDSSVLEYPIVGTLDEVVQHLREGADTVVALGDNQRRMSVLENIESASGVLASVVHPTAVISRSAKIGPGSVICAGSVINTRAALGRGVIVNTGATVDHDCIIGDGVHISPGAHVAGGVEVGERAWIGVGASVRDGIRIGGNAVIGVGAAVVSDVQGGQTVVGIPARELVS